MKPPLHTRSVGTKVTDAEYATLEARARGRSLTLSEWVRAVLLASSPKSGAEAGDRVLLAEVLALRTILVNLLFSIGKGDTMLLSFVQWPLIAKGVVWLVQKFTKRAE
jgi:hypothetical protein